MPHAPPEHPTQPIHVTLLRAIDDSTLAKEFYIAPDGTIQKTSHAQFSRGIAWKKSLPKGLRSLPGLIDDLEPTDCIATGTFDEDKVRVVPKGFSIETTDSVPTRHRTKDSMRQPEPGVILLDHDQGPYMQDSSRCETPLELMQLISGAVPAFKGVEWVGRGSSSQGIFNERIGKAYSTSGGIHVYVAVNTSDLATLRRDLEVALWRAGLGYVEFARNGCRLRRTIIDLSVLSPERLIFEAPPILGPGVGRVPPVWEYSHD